MIESCIVSVLSTVAVPGSNPTIAATLSAPSGGGSHHHLSSAHGAKGIRPHKSSTNVAFLCVSRQRLFLDTSPPQKAKQQAVIPVEALSACLCAPPSNHSIRPASPRSPARFNSPVTVIGTGQCYGWLGFRWLIPTTSMVHLLSLGSGWPWLLRVARRRWRSS